MVFRTFFCPCYSTFSNQEVDFRLAVFSSLSVQRELRLIFEIMQAMDARPWVVGLQALAVPFAI
jgi:hypothetical protein